MGGKMISKEEYEKISVDGEAGGGLVKVTVNGFGLPTSVTIDDSIFNSNDKQFISDLFVAATTNAIRKCDELVKKIVVDEYNKYLDSVETSLYSVLGKNGFGNDPKN
jgi:DNA-binding YbaB/EbfC family protein